MKLLVRTFEELNKLVKEGRKDEITKEEWEALSNLIETIADAFEPLITDLQISFGQLLAWFEELVSNLETED